MHRLTLTTRTFLLSFVPICLLLIGTFLAINHAIHERVRQDLRDALYNSDQLLNRANAEFSRENSVLLAKLTDSAGLKASIGLLSEANRDPALAKQVRATIEAQLWELHRGSTYDFLAISDLQGEVVAAIGAKDPAILPHQGLADNAGAIFQFESVPIDMGGETAGVLTLGRPFDLKRLSAGGDAVLLQNRKIVSSTFAPNLVGPLEQQLQKNCSSLDGGCEVEAGGSSYVVSPLQHEQLGNHYRLLVFRSLDAPLQAFNSAFLPQLIEVALVGIIFALICTIVTTRSVVRPLHLLVSQLETGADSGKLPEKLDAGKGVREVDLVASAFNRVAAAERQSQSELIVAKQTAEKANRLKTEFLNNMSHELRTPINGVLGMADLLTSTELTEEQAEYNATIVESAHILITLIDEILDLSELETGRLRLKTGPLEPARILDDICAAIRPRASKKALAIEVSPSPDLPPCCISEDKRIRQVLMHLCDNAVKFTASGLIRIASHYSPLNASRGHLTFSVEDTGIGIAEADIQLVFQPFTQLDGSLTRQNGGTGIGLSITKALIELMGGHIGVKSTPGGGSTFWFSVPVELVPSRTEQPEQREVLETR